MRVESTYQSFIVTCEHCGKMWDAVIEGSRIVWDDEHPEKSDYVMPPKLECPNCKQMTS